MAQFYNMIEVEDYIWKVILFRHVTSKGINNAEFRKEALEFLWNSDRVPPRFRDSEIFHHVDFFLRYRLEKSEIVGSVLTGSFPHLENMN